MATNKRKDAAALFELIDKSTLKVPKHAGALKIPDWWSSKSNPASETPAAAGAGNEGGAKPVVKAMSPAKTSPVTASDNTSANESASAARLFEPPPASAQPGTSPSIRPPSLNGSSKGALPTSSSPSIPKPTAGQSRATEPEGKPSAPRRPIAMRMAEQLANASKTDWSTNHQRRNSRRPAWVPVAIGGVVVLCIILLVGGIWMARQHSHAVTSGTGAEATGGQGTDSGNSEAAGGGGLLPPPTQQHPLLPPVAGGGTPGSGDTDNAGDGNAAAGGTIDTGIPAGTVGKVYEKGTVPRSPDLYYVMISSTPSATVAQKNAEFLAQHGVDVSIEVVAGPGTKNNRWYKLISVKGFPSMVAAEPFRKQIVLIGHLHPDFKKYKKVWDDAFVTRVVSVK